MNSRHQDFISESRTDAKVIWDALNRLEGRQKEWNALDYGNTLEPGEGSNEGMTSVEVGAVVFDTANALRAVMNQGHATNVAKLL